MDGGGHDGSSLALPYLMFIDVALLIIGAMSLKAGFLTVISFTGGTTGDVLLWFIG
jgi:uncharacterized membrane-anchored protein